MKYNNTQNFINTTDVNHFGQGLNKVLSQYNEDIETLKGNVKWLYKNGGMGSKGGGGGSGSGNFSWYAYGTIDAYAFQSGITNSDLNFAKPGEEHDFTLAIAHPSGGVFTCKATFNDGQKDTSIQFTLSQSNSWYYATRIKLGGNTLLQITVTDQNNDPAIISMNYSTTAYSFSIQLVDNQNKPYETDNITFDEAVANGLQLAIKYNVGVQNLAAFTPSLLDAKGVLKELRAVSLANSKSGVVYYNIVHGTDEEVQEFFSDKANTGTYNLLVTISAVVGTVAADIDPMQLTFNLLPSDLYFKVAVDSGSVYSKPQNLASADSFYEGTVEIKITPFFGEMKTRPITYQVSLDGNTVTDWVSTTERATTSATIILQNNIEHASSNQQHVITITGNTTYGADSQNRVSTDYYIYSKRVISDLTWYPVEGSGNDAIEHGPTNQNYWRGSGEQYGLNVRTNGAYIEMTNNSVEQIIEVESNPTSAMDVMFSIGIQYSEINNENNPVISLYEEGTSSSEGYFSIYPKEIMLGNSLGLVGLGSSVPVALNKTSANQFKGSSNKEFHLLTIYKRYLHSRNSIDYYEVNYYVDGVMEGAISNYSTAQIQFNRIKLHKGNYFVNLLEVSYFKHFAESNNYDYLTDVGVCRYWYRYRQIKRGETEVSTDILSYANSFQLDKTLNKQSDTDYGHSQYNYVKISSLSDIQNVAKIAGVPCILFTAAETSKGEFLSWITQGYSENGGDPRSFDVGVQYCDGKSDLQTITCQGAFFRISVQGSTTRGYRGKNLDLALVAYDPNDGNTYLYSPNFDPNDPNTFLPETKFTLKADAVDSSHSNNTTMGKFINRNTTAFEQARSWQTQTCPLVPYIKNCLDGFVTLVFVAIQGPDNSYEYRYFGVYNFNLGRGSYNNLGYTDLNKLNNNINIQSGFHCYSLPSNQNELKSTVLCAEIAGNRAQFDFSQYDESVLYQTDSYGKVVDGVMFGDIVNGDAQRAEVDIIKPFVSQVARAGGYIFESMGKTFGSYDESYHAHVGDNYYVGKNQVPNYKTQFKYVMDDQGKYGYVVSDTVVGDPDVSVLNYLVRGDEDNLAMLDITSDIEYYTVCMAFGLVDSVQKNLNIKTWNQHTFYVAFYDMDTCLGIDNEGKDTNYYAYSDYWETYESKETDYDIDKPYHDNLYKNSAINIYRDFSPNPTRTGFKGYDTPTSYLFTIAKYASLFNDDISFPAAKWAQWRSETGPLRSADYFINTYYASHLNAVPEILLTFNYRTKYLETNASFNGFDTVNFIKFKGRRLQKVEDWLTNRFHILDAYFNLSNANSVIQKWDDTYDHLEIAKFPSGANMVERKPDSYIYSTNSDVYLAQSIFGTNARVNGTIDMIVQAKDYSPLFITDNQNVVTRYLLTDSNKYYYIRIPGQGNNTYTFGGSASWTYLNSINCFNEALTLSSNLLTSLNGTAGNISEWNINMPSLKSVSLTSSGYAGILKFDSTMTCPDLTDIDISNSGIKLTVNGKAITTLKAAGCQNASLDISNCSLMSNVSISGSFTNVSITQLPVSMNLDSTRITNLSLSTTLVNRTFRINNDQALETLQLSGFSSVTVSNCPNLKTISIGNSDNQQVNTISITTASGIESVLENLSISGEDLTSLTITGQNELEKVSISGLENNKLRTLNLSNSAVAYFNDTTEYLDLSNITSFTSFNMKNNSGVEAIKFNNSQSTPINLTNDFSGCLALTRVYGHIKISNDSLFKGLIRFSIHGTTATTWKGYQIKDASGRVMMPYQLLGKSDNKIINSSELFWPTDQENEGLVTNFTWNISNPSSFFQQTACSLFDIYFFFSSIQPSWTDLSRVFYQSTIGRFGLSATVDNSPDVHMFDQCGNITTMANLFYSHSGYLTFKSPSHTGDTINADDGLFSPLVNLENMSRTWGGYTYVCDRFVFRRKTGNYKLLNLGYFYPALIVKDINQYKYMQFSTANEGNIAKTMRTLKIRLGKATDVTSKDDDYQNYQDQLNGTNNTLYGSDYAGNLSNFFDNLPDLTSMHAFCDGMWYVNYDSWWSSNTSKLKFPVDVDTYKAVLRCKFGTGTIRLTEYFITNSTTSTGDQYNSKVRYLYHSFMVLNDYNSNSDIGNLGTCNFYLNNDTFSKLQGLYTISYDSSGDNSSSSYLLSSFCGNGVNKIINELNEFPYDIFGRNANLQKVNSLFYKATLDKNLSWANPVKLPGRMFQYHFRIQDISALFYDMAVDYQLSEYNEATNSLNFTKCTGLQKLDYTFANSAGKTTYAEPRLTGSIPYKFLYHGGVRLSGGSYLGTNNEPARDIVVDPETGDSIVVIDYGKPETCEYEGFEQPNATITSMTYCFMHASFDGYTNTNPEVVANENYNPFKYLAIKTGVNSEGEPIYSWGLNPNQKIDINKRTYKWAYDGSNEPQGFLTDCEPAEIRTIGHAYNVCCVGDGAANFIYITLPGTDRSSATRFDNAATWYNEGRVDTYFCPPDLLRYCTKNCSVAGLFAYCGVYGWAQNYNGTGGTQAYANHSDPQFRTQEKGANFNKMGIRGRIPPYLLQPVEETTSISNMFRNCKLLTALRDQTTGYSYIIPEKFFEYAPKITDFSYAFSGLLMPQDTKLDTVFNKLTSNNLNLEGIFHKCYWDGNDSTRCTISRVFINYDVISTKYAFSQVTVYNDQTNRRSAQFVTFSEMFKSKYTSSAYNNATEYSFTFAGYTKQRVETEEGLPNTVIPVASLEEGGHTLNSTEALRNYYYT